MTAIKHGLDELVAATVPWQWAIVEAAMFAHAAHPDCVGWTIGYGSMCKAWCGHCKWEIAARIDESAGAATFAMIALGIVGIGIANILRPAIEWCEAMGLHDYKLELLPDGIVVNHTVYVNIEQVAFTHRIDL